MFWDRVEGSVLPIFAVAILAIFLASGAAVDYAGASRAKQAIQEASDTAILAAAKDYVADQPVGELNAAVDAFLAENLTDLSAARSGDVRYLSASSEICVDLESLVRTSFVQVVGYSHVTVRSTSCASVGSPVEFEIALVVDVSSSMIEEGRFEPMRAAVKAFLAAFKADAGLKQRSRIAIVPFSSRVNVGLSHTAWLVSHDGAPAVPSRWTDPTAKYGSKYTEVTWTDGVTKGYDNGKNIYWLGCIEPRIDVAVDGTGAVSAASRGDGTPSSLGLVAMDSNPGSGQSFCPPPIVPLTGDFSLLETSADALTSQGSTRLDAGMVAGWYALSPKWKGLWGETSLPKAASKSLRKVVVFMTDGEMNTQYGQSSDKLDWLCKSETSKACNTTANSELVKICTAMKSSGIEIYTISYGDDADSKNLLACASATANHFTAADAGKSGGAAESIAAVYTKIAKGLINDSLRLSR